MISCGFLRTKSAEKLGKISHLVDNLRNYNPYPYYEFRPFINKKYNDNFSSSINKLLNCIDFYLEETEIILSFMDFERFMSDNKLTFRLLEKNTINMLSFMYRDLINTRILEEKLLEDSHLVFSNFLNDVNCGTYDRTPYNKSYIGFLRDVCKYTSATTYASGPFSPRETSSDCNRIDKFLSSELKNSIGYRVINDSSIEDEKLGCQYTRIHLMDSTVKVNFTGVRKDVEYILNIKGDYLNYTNLFSVDGLFNYQTMPFGVIIYDLGHKPKRTLLEDIYKLYGEKS